MCFTFKRNCWRSRASNGLSCASALWVGVVSPRRLVLGPYLCVDRSREESGSQGKRVNITETIFSSSPSSRSFLHILQQRASSVFTVCSLCQYDTFSLQQRFLQWVFFLHILFLLFVCSRSAIASCGKMLSTIVCKVSSHLAEWKEQLSTRMFSTDYLSEYIDA